MKTRNLFTLLAGWLAASVAVDAQTAPTTPNATSAKEPIVELPAFNVSAEKTDQYRATDSISASRIRGAILDSPGSISVLTPELLLTIAPTRAYDATRFVAGVSEGRANSFSDRAVIRGFENTGRTIDNFISVQNQNTDSLFTDRVEVVKGPNAILAPTGTPGGSINIVSKIPLYQRANLLTATIGLNDAQRLDLDVTGPFAPNSPAAYRVLGAIQDGHLNLQGGSDRRKIIGGQFSYRFSQRTNLVVRAGYEWRKQFVPISVYVDSADVNGAYADLAPGFGWTGNRNGQEDWAYRGGRYMSSDLLLTSSFGDHISLRVASKAQLGVQNDNFVILITPGLNNRYDPYSGLLTPNNTWALDKTTGRYVSTFSPYFDMTNLVRQPQWPHDWTQDYAGQADLAATYRFGPVSSTTVAGVAYEHTIDFNIRRVGANVTGFNQLAPVYGKVPRTFEIINQRSSSNAGTWQSYVNERVGLLSDRVFLSAGAVRVAATRRATNLLSNVFTSLDDSKDLYLFGVVVKPLKNVSVYGSRSVNAVPTITNNKPLWQEGAQYEFGVKFSGFNDRLSFSAARFQISQSNVTVPNPAYNIDNTQPQSLISDIKEYGYEFELVGGITRNLSTMASLSFLRQRDSLGRPVRAVAGQTAALLLNYLFTTGPLHELSAFVGASCVGRRSGEAVTPDFGPLGAINQPSFYLRPLTLVSFGIKYPWTKHLTLELKVDNAFSEKYVIPTARNNNTPGDPRNVRLTTRYNF